MEFTFRIELSKKCPLRRARHPVGAEMWAVWGIVVSLPGDGYRSSVNIMFIVKTIFLHGGRCRRRTPHMIVISLPVRTVISSENCGVWWLCTVLEGGTQTRRKSTPGGRAMENSGNNPERNIEGDGCARTIKRYGITQLAQIEHGR